MTLSAKLRRAPGRLVTGAFILNSGLGKLGGDDDTAKQIHGMASGAYPALEKIPPNPFLKAVGAAEVVLGGALLVPIVPAGVAGLGLAGFSGGLLGMWWRTPGMHQERSLRPTKQGIPIAKDAWMLGIGAALMVDAALDPVRNKRIELTTDARVATARRAARARSTAKVGRVRAEAKAARASARAGATARSARRATRDMLEHVTP